MPAIIVMLLGGLVRIVGKMAVEVLVALGIGIVTYTGAEAGISVIKAQAISAFSGLPPGVFSLLGLLKVGTCMSIVFSAVAIRMGLNGTRGAIKRFKLK